MNKLDLHPLSLIYPPDVQSDALTPQPASFSPGSEVARRVIVLTPSDSDYITATRRVWELANTLHARVQFLGLCRDAAEEPSLRRQLITMSALVQDGRVVAEAKVEIGTNWVDAVKTNYHIGDVIVCFAEQRVGLFHRPLSQILESNLGATVYILSGLYTSSTSRSNWLSQVIVWVGSFAILAGFFWLQVRISQLPQDPAQTVLLVLSAGVEIWLI